MRLNRPQAVTDAVLYSSNVDADEHPAWAVDATYAAEDRVQVDAADLHLVFESKDAGNIGHDPLADDSADYWLLVGPTNRWRMFDPVVQSQTTNPDSIEIELDLAGYANTVTLLNMSAQTVRAIQTDDVEGVVFDQTFDLVSASGITDLSGYLFETIERVTDIELRGLRYYANARLKLILSAPGETVAIGACIPGHARELGGTQWGVTLGIRDYSKKTQDDFGGFVVVKRAFSKTAQFSVWLAPGFVDKMMRLLETYRATPVVWVGDNEYASTIIYGFYSDARVEIAGKRVSALSIDTVSVT